MQSLPLPLLVGCMAILLMAPAWAQASQPENIYYDQELLCVYIQLCQQLRNEFKTLLANATDRVSNLQTARNGVKAVIQSGVSEAINLQSDVLIRLSAVSSTVGLDYGGVLSAWIASDYSDTAMPPFTHVKRLHGFLYDAKENALTISVPGVYLIEVKVQMAGATWAKSYAHIYTPDRELVKTITFLWAAGYNPYMEMFDLEAGFKITFSGLVPWFNFSGPIRPSLVGKDEKSQLSVRYVGPSS